MVDKINVRFDGTSVIAMWNVTMADGWTPMYRVTAAGDNGDVVFNQDVGGSPSETLTNLTENIQYNVTVYVRAREDMSCLSSESVIVTSKRNVHAFSIINYRSIYSGTLIIRTLWDIPKLSLL